MMSPPELPIATLLTIPTPKPPTSHFYLYPYDNDEPDPAITLALNDAVNVFKVLLAYLVFHCLFARRASVSAAIGLYLIALSLLCGFEGFDLPGVYAAMTGSSSTNTGGTSTIAPISCLYTCPDSQPTTATSPHALDNAIQVLEFTLLTFVLLRLLVRVASIGALVGLSLIIGGFLWDVGVGFPGVDAASTTTVYEPVVECSASGQTRFTLWILSAALAVLMLALVIGHRRRSMPGPFRSLTTYRPLVGRMLVIDKPVTSSSAEGARVREHPLNSLTVITTGNVIARHHLIRTKLAGTLLGLIFLAILVPLTFAAGPSPEVTKRSASAVQ